MWVKLGFLLCCCCSLLLLSVKSESRQYHCKSEIFRRISIEKVSDQFKSLKEDRFVGQDQAYDITLSALRKFKGNDLLLLHFVGASGVGKTHLANLVIRSFFAQQLCPDYHLGYANKLLCPILTRVGVTRGEAADLAFTQACGLGFVDFLSVENSDAAAKAALESALERAFVTRISDDEPVILLFDNFNLCKDSCEKLMTRIVLTRQYHVKNDDLNINKLESLKNCVILVTSDLSMEGLRLFPGEERSVAMQRILDVVGVTWGEDSLWNDRAFIVPFAPYSDLELVKILELTIKEFEKDLEQNIAEALDREKAKRNIKYGEVKWVGRFVFAENDKTRILDQLHREITSKSCRAFERIKGKMIAASRRPEHIENRLLQYRPLASKSDVPNTVARFAQYLVPNAVFSNLEYTQNIVFKAVDDARMIVLEVDDIDSALERERLEL